MTSVPLHTSKVPTLRVKQVVPESLTGTTQAVKDDNPIHTSKLLALLVR